MTSNLFKKENKNKTFITLLTIIFLLGIIFDIEVNITGKHLIIVKEEYAFSIYTAICMVGILCISAIALLTGILDKEYFGFKLKDLLSFGLLDIKRYIIVSLLIIVISTLLLSFTTVYCVVNLMTSVFVVLVLIEILTLINICDILVDNENCYAVIEKHFKDYENGKTNKTVIDHDINCLFSGIDTALNTNNNDEAETIFGFFNYINPVVDIEEFSKEHHKIYLEILRRANSISLKWGYSTFIHIVFKLSCNNSDERTEYLNEPIRNVEFMDDKTILNANYLSSLFEIFTFPEYKNGEFDDQAVHSLLLRYFQMINENNLLSKSVKDKLLNDFWDRLCLFYWEPFDKNGLRVDYAVALNIFKDYIFTDVENIDKEELMGQFLNALKRGRYHKDDLGYWYFISQIIEAFYTFRFEETELVDEEARKKIGEVYKYKPSSINREKYNLSYFLDKDIKNVFKALGDKVIKRKENIDIFEYWPNYSQAKGLVWTLDHDVKFAFIIYNLYWDELYSIDFWDLCFDNYTNWDNEKEAFVLDTLLNLFDKETMIYNENFNKELEQAAFFFESPYVLPFPGDQRSIFDEFNKLKKELNQSREQNEIPKEDIRKFQNDFDDFLKINTIYGVDNSENIDEYISYAIEPIVCEKSDNRTPISLLYFNVTDAIKDCIERKADFIEISYNENGIDKMIDLLKGRTFDSSNFSFINSWGLFNYHNSRSYIELKDIYSSLEIVKTPNIYQQLLFNRDNFNFKVQITEISRTELDEKNCEEYLNGYRTQSGLYSLQRALYTHSEAVDFIMKYYCILNIRFDLYYTLSKQDVIRIKVKPC